MSAREIPPDVFARQMARREIVFYRPEPLWQNGLVIGNGDLGGAVFSEQTAGGASLGITLNKVDVWDERYDRHEHRYHTLAELRELIRANAGSDEGRLKLRALEPYCMVGAGGKNEWYQKTYPYAYAPPTPKPVGMVRLSVGASYPAFEQRLSIHRGEVSLEVGDETAGCRATAHIDANTNVLTVHVQRRGAEDTPLRLEFARYVDEQLGPPEVHATADGFWHRYHFPDGFTYAVYGVVRCEGKVAARAQSGTWRDVQARNGWITGKPGMINWDEPIEAANPGVLLELAPGVNEATLFVAAATSKEQGDPLAHAKAQARQASERSEAAYEAHLAWWDGFWRKSSLLLSDRLVETLWYQGLYALALQARGSLPPSLIGPGYYLPHAAWNGHFITDFNVEMNAWPIYAANHLELGRPIFDFFRRHLADMQADARELYGLEGIKVPGICVGTGRELSYIPCRLWQSSSAWIAQLYWWAYEYSRDLDFLKDTAYPLLREASIFYRGYAELGEDGRYHIFPSTPPEQAPWWATDPAIDMALLRVHLRATLEAARLLGADEDLRPGWQDLLDRLADIPTNGDVILDDRNASPEKGLGHAGLLMAVFSAGLIGARSPEADRGLALRSLDNAIAHTSRKVVDYPLDIPTWNDDCNWPYLLSVAARLGLKEQTRAYLYDYGLLQHVKPNGLFAFDCPLDDGQRASRWGMPDSSHALTAAISEMLIQSYDGAIHVAPAVPADWDASLAGFLAVGAFEVDADIRGGQATRLEITSQRGGECRVVNPWVGRAVRVRAGDEAAAAREEAGVIHFDTRPGQVYRLSPEGDSAPEAAPGFDETPGEPMAYRGPAYLWDVPEEKRMRVRVGLGNER